MRWLGVQADAQVSDSRSVASTGDEAGGEGGRGANEATMDAHLHGAPPFPHRTVSLSSRPSPTCQEVVTPTNCRDRHGVRGAGRDENPSLRPRNVEVAAGGRLDDDPGRPGPRGGAGDEPDRRAPGLREEEEDPPLPLLTDAIKTAARFKAVGVCAFVTLICRIL
jgi:hypothetical protein